MARKPPLQPRTPPGALRRSVARAGAGPGIAAKNRGAGGGNATKGIAQDVWAWACEVGELPHVRLVVAGYDDGRKVPQGWTTVPWRATGGFARKGTPGAANAARERLWCSPACERP